MKRKSRKIAEIDSQISIHKSLLKDLIHKSLLKDLKGESADMNKRVNRRIREINYQIAYHEAALRKVGEERVKAYADSFLTCEHCNRKSKVGTVTLIDYYRWDDNIGSPCGGFNVHYEYRWECTKCGYHGPAHSIDYIIPHGAFETERKEYNR
jgi:ribosomal protein L37AE/L43A